MKRKHRSKTKRVVIRMFTVTVGILILTVIAVGGVLIAPYTKVKMDMTLMDIPAAAEPAHLLAYTPENRVLRSGALHPAAGCVLTDVRPREAVSYGEIPPDLINAFIAIEDKRFRQHRGVDLLRTTRAGLGYLMGNPDCGGSTITQQLVKNLTGCTDPTPDRKLTEIARALDLERQTDKTAILEAYLNIINLAEGCFGVDMAAETYFSKPVSDLTLPECAAIAAITNNPARYDPLTHPENNQARRNLILHEMAKQGYITEEERDEAIATPLVLSPAPKRDPAPVTSWYADMVARDVIRDLCDRLGYTYAAASMLVYSGGLTVETAMDEELQSIVETYYADPTHFPEGDAGRPQSSCILIDPYTGDILAVAGAVGQKTANRLQNYATDTYRPAGSCIKPLSVYAPALDRGLITWGSIFEDEPLCEKGGVPWPANADGLYRGRVTVGEAMAHSLNPVSVRILTELGAEESFAFTREKLGLNSLIPKGSGEGHDLTVSSLALGQQSRGITLRELTGGYTVFSDGIFRAPVSYHRVLDREGKVLLENKPAGGGARAISPETAALMTRLLMTVTDHGTAARSITLPQALGIECAGKTGTTQRTCDRLYVGYTPRLLAGVWMGYDYPTELRGISGNPCVGVWDSIMTACETRYKGAPVKPHFDVCDSLVEQDFCPLSGCIPNEYCTDPLCGHPLEHGWFVRGTQPTDVCDVHEEPPIRVTPADPADPDRIPLLPNDLLPEIEPPEETEPPCPEAPWYSRWFSFFTRR